MFEKQYTYHMHCITQEYPKSNQQVLPVLKSLLGLFKYPGTTHACRGIYLH